MHDQTIHIVDDDLVTRELLTEMLRITGYGVQTYASAEAFLLAQTEDRPGCLVLDIQLPGMNGDELQDEMARRGMSLPIVFLTGHGDIPTSVRAMRGGAVDFLVKPVTRDTLLKAIKEALVIDARERQLRGERDSCLARLQHLTERERQILDMAISGLQNKEIARDLGLSHRTVEAHRARIFLKLGVNSIIEAVRLVNHANPRI
jgi:FixJ family two-component response regulator